MYSWMDGVRNPNIVRSLLENHTNLEKDNSQGVYTNLPGLSENLVDSRELRTIDEYKW